jgi:hypothetical protein
MRIEAYGGRRLIAKSKDLSSISMRRNKIRTHMDGRDIDSQYIR